MEHRSDFHINLVDGPSAEELDLAIDAIYRADHPTHPTCAEVNAEAIANGENPPYKWDDDIQLRYVTLIPATLRFAYRGEFIKRHFTIHATKIVADGDYYNIEGYQFFTIRRNFISNTDEIVRLYPLITYTFTIRYNATIRGGRILAVQQKAEDDDCC